MPQAVLVLYYCFTHSLVQEDTLNMSVFFIMKSFCFVFEIWNFFPNVFTCNMITDALLNLCLLYMIWRMDDVEKEMCLE